MDKDRRTRNHQNIRFHKEAFMQQILISYAKDLDKYTYAVPMSGARSVPKTYVDKLKKQLEEWGFFVDKPKRIGSYLMVTVYFNNKEG